MDPSLLSPAAAQARQRETMEKNLSEFPPMSLLEQLAFKAGWVNGYQAALGAVEEIVRAVSGAERERDVG